MYKRQGYGCDALQALCHFAAGLYYIGYGRRGGKAGWRYADYASSRQGGAVAVSYTHLDVYKRQA